MKIKSRYNTLLAILLLAFTVVNFLIYLADYIYRPKNYIVFIIAFLAAVIALTVLSVMFRKTASKASRIFEYTMPVFSFLFGVSLHFALDLRLIIILSIFYTLKSYLYC